MTLVQKGRRIALLGLVLLAGVYVRAVVFTPVERFQGPAQKIFYLHVPAAVWGKPVWGTWWTWDARLTLTLFLFFLYVGYQLMRGAVTEPGLRARYSAVLGICGLVLVPFIHLSTVLFRTLHPQPIVLKPSAPSLPGSMLATLLFSFAVFTLLYVGFVVQRYALALLRDEREGVERA